MPNQQTDSQHKIEKDGDWQFPGFVSPTTTAVPDQFFDELLSRLSGAEAKTLLYICRRTFGFKKRSDNISLSQLVRGIKTKDGRVLDRGTGLGTASVARALTSLEANNIIVRTRRRSPRRGDTATSYALNIVTPVSQNETPPVPKTDGGLSHQRDTQHTVSQQTDDTVVVKELVDLKVGKDKARELAARFSAQHIGPKIDLLRWKLDLQAQGKTTGRPIHDPAAWLIRAIETDFQPPAGFRTTAERERERAKKAFHEKHEAQHRQRQQDKREKAQTQRLAQLESKYGTGRREHSLWSATKGAMETRAGNKNQALLHSILAHSALLAVGNGEAVIVLRNGFASDWVRRKHAGLIQDLLAKQLAGRAPTLRFLSLEDPHDRSG